MTIPFSQNKAIVDIRLLPRSDAAPGESFDFPHFRVAYSRQYVTSSIKPEVHNVSQCRESRNKPRPAVGSIQINFGEDLVAVVTFFIHNFVNCKAALILAIKIYEIKHNTSLNDVHT